MTGVKQRAVWVDYFLTMCFMMNLTKVTIIFSGDKGTSHIYSRHLAFYSWPCLFVNAYARACVTVYVRIILSEVLQQKEV